MAGRSVGIEGGDIPAPMGGVMIGCEVTAVKVEFNMHEIGMESHTHARMHALTHAHTHTRTHARTHAHAHAHMTRGQTVRNTCIRTIEVH